MLVGGSFSSTTSTTARMLSLTSQTMKLRDVPFRMLSAIFLCYASPEEALTAAEAETLGNIRCCLSAPRRSL